LKKIIAGFLFAICQLAAGRALAGPYADQMAQCMVRQTSAEERTMLVQWVFAITALHPDVKQLSTVTDDARSKLNKRFADLTMALLTERCARETREVLKNEGPDAFQASFGELGKSAMEGLFTDTRVSDGLTEFTSNIDEAKLKKFVEDSR